MKSRAIRLILLAAIALFAVGCGGAPDDVEPEEVDIEAAREAYLEWEERITDIHTMADELMASYEKVVTGLSDGRYDIFSAYDYVSNKLIPANSNLEGAMRLIEPGSALSKKHQEDLRSAKSDLAYGIYWRTEAFKEFLKFLDTQQLSLMNDIKSNLGFANYRMVEGISKYIGVKAELCLLEGEDGDAQE